MHASVAKPRRKTIRPGLIESLVRSIAEGLVDPKMQGPNFSWLETFPSLGARLTEGQLGLGYFKVHPHHLEEIKQKAQEVAEEYARRQPGGRVAHPVDPAARLAALASALEAKGYTTKTWAGEWLYIRHPEVPDREIGHLSLGADGAVVISRCIRRARVWRDEIAQIVAEVQS